MSVLVTIRPLINVEMPMIIEEMPMIIEEMPMIIEEESSSFVLKGKRGQHEGSMMSLPS
jgi:hypothetical protein